MVLSAAMAVPLAMLMLVVVFVMVVAIGFALLGQLTAEDGKIVEEKIIAAPAEGHGALVGFLVSQGVDTLICGGIGGGAVNGLRSSGIKVYAGASGPVKEQVLSLLSGQLPQQGEANCDHHDEHDHEHQHGQGHGHGCGQDHE